MLVEEFQLVFMMGVVVLPEHKVGEVIVLVDQRKVVQLVFPDDVIGIFEGSGIGGSDELFTGRHELFDFGGRVHTRYTVVLGTDDAEELAVRGTVIGDGDGGVTGALFQSQDIGKGVVRSQVARGDNEALLIVLDAGDHGGLRLDGLGAEDEGDTAFFG